MQKHNSGESAPSNVAGATPSWSAPAAPTNLIATAATGTQINLTWSDRSTNETGFKIERRIASSNYQQIAIVSAGTTAYADTNLSPGVAYTYRVRAYNSGGIRTTAGGQRYYRRYIGSAGGAFRAVGHGNFQLSGNTGLAG